MTKLNQIVALEKGVKARAYADVTAAHRSLTKNPLMSGISRTYQPRDDQGETLPPESTRVQTRTSDAVTSVEAALVRLFDITLIKDVANGRAIADIKVDGNVLVEKVPVTTLLFLEKQLNDLLTFVRALPVLDAAESWTYSATQDAYATAPSKTTRTKKIPKSFSKAKATDRHPEQVEMYYEDVIVGDWTTTKFSGALPQADVTAIRERVVNLIEAVKVARESANSIEVIDVAMGSKILDYVFG